MRMKVGPFATTDAFALMSARSVRDMGLIESPSRDVSVSPCMMELMDATSPVDDGESERTVSAILRSEFRMRMAFRPIL